MLYSPKIEKAIRKAAEMHLGCNRKGDGHTPYITHLFAVALILSDFTDNEEAIIGAILHDTVEDTTYSFAEMERDFGSEIRKIVEFVTEKTSTEKTQAGWNERKESYLKKLEMAPEESLLISAADKIHNLHSIIFDYEKVGSDIWQQFNSTREDKIKFHEGVLNILEKRLDNDIVKELEKVLNSVKKLK